MKITIAKLIKLKAEVLQLRVRVAEAEMKLFELGKSIPIQRVKNDERQTDDPRT